MPARLFNSLFGGRKSAVPAPRVPDGQRVYAIGDIHGRDDLFAELVGLIDADDAARGPADTSLVLLGDLVDRGPDTRGVVDRAIALKANRPTMRVIAGNHEEIFLKTIEGHREMTRLFARVGGLDTLTSYGIDEQRYIAADFEELHGLIRLHVPIAHSRFIAGMEDVVEIGDYVFVHAGIRPDVPLAEQTTGDLRWIRRDFLDHRAPFERFVIHGHTITDAPDERPNRIGIDTGAFASGRLTAIGLEGDLRWYLAT
ncbi:metallophosphoesterase family protein [Sphingomonas sp. RS2018]